MSTAIPEVASLDGGSTECRELLERVINSRELRRALRLRELLEYIGKHSQNNSSQVIREQEIGAAVFGRTATYDTSLDNIVRVNVSELRKRLSHYFAEEGASETIVVEIPRGGYLLVFLPRTLAVEEKPQEIPAQVQSTVDAVGPVDPVEIAPIAASRNHVTPLVVALVLVLLGCGALIWQNHRLAVQLQPWKSEALAGTLWGDFFGSSTEVDIVTADTSFAMAEDILGHAITLDDYLDYTYQELPNQPGISADKKAALQIILGRNNGSVGDFQAAKRFMDLAMPSAALRLASARSYTAESIKSNNVILLGGRQSNPWVELYKDRMNFFMEYEPGVQRSYVVNRNPQPGEKAVYELMQDKKRSYSVVTFLPNMGEHRYALILSGTDSQATRAAAEFITTPDGLAQIRQKIATGRFPYFELVLLSTRLSGTTLKSEIVAYRVHER